MEKKFTKDMVCSEFESKCRECPLFCTNNFKSLPCSVLTDDDINTIMKDYPYADVKVRMMFNDIETRLTSVEKKVENNVSVEFKPESVVFGCSYNRDIGFSAEVVAKNLYDKLEAKHEADCRLISEYDLEIKRLKEEISTLNKQIDFFVLTCLLYKKENKDLKSDVEKKDAENNKLEDEIDKHRRHVAELKDKLFDLKNAENERDHYKGLYSSKCDDYDNLLAKQLKTEKDFTFYRNAYMKSIGELEETNERQHSFKEENIKLTEQKDRYKELFHSLNHKHQKVVGEMKCWKEKYDDACKMNKMREDVFESNLKLKKTIEAKDREIDLLRAELDKYKTDDECDDRWID